MPITDYHRNSIRALLTASNIRLALYTVAPTVAGGGTEVTGGSYARQDPDFIARPGQVGQVWNNVEVTFTGMPACTVVAQGVVDATSGGNLLYYAVLPTPQVFDSGDPAIIEINEFIVVAQ